MIVNVLLLVFLLLVLYGILQNHILGKNNQQIFLNKDITGALRGIAIVAIVFSHICQAEPSLRDLIIGGKYTYTIIFTWGGDRGSCVFSPFRVWMFSFNR